MLSIQLAGKPGERQLFAQILYALGINQGLRAGAVDMQFVVVRLLKAIGLQVLVIDEVHNILAGTARDQRIVLNTLRYLSNELNISLVCFGVTDAREAISGDAQLARRFDEMTLTRWSSTAAFEELMISILILLCHKLARWQQGHRGKRRAMLRASLMRMVAIDALVWRSARIGGSAGSITLG